MVTSKEKIVTACEFEISCRICGKRLGFAEIPIIMVCQKCKYPESEKMPIAAQIEILEKCRNIPDSHTSSLVITESGRVLSKNGKKEKTWLKIV